MPSLTLEPVTASVSVAGDHAEAVAEQAGWASDDRDRVVLATIEAIGNAVEHGPSLPIRLMIRAAPGHQQITVEVEDGGDGPRSDYVMNPSLPDAHSIDGRGLYILNALADSVRLDGKVLVLTFRPRGGA